MSKAYQYAINNEKVTTSLNKLMWRLPKVVYKKQSHGQRNEKMKGRNGKWHVLRKGYGFENSKPQWKQDLWKTRFTNKVIMFEEVLEFKKVILLCYG
jgi:hypothetical protein